MKKILILTFFIISFFSCSQSKKDNNNQVKIVFDYQGKELSEKEIQQLFKKEMEHFDSIQSKENIQIIKINNFKPNIKDTRNTSLKSTCSFYVKELLVNP